MKVCVTGASGFIGSNLVLQLYKQGYDVIGLDIRDVNPLMIQYKDSHPNEHYKLQNIQMLKVDLSSISSDKLTHILKDCDIVIHLASPIGVQNVLENPSQTMYKALKINLTMHEVCESLLLPIIFSSSSEVFGNNDNINDTSMRVVPDTNHRWTYSIQKMCGEALYDSSSYKSCIVRFFNVTGLNQDTNMVLSKFVHNALNNIPLTIMENGKRSFCDVHTIVKHLIKTATLMVNNATYERFQNLGNPNNYCSALELANRVIQIAQQGEIIDESDSYPSLIPERKLQVTHLDLTQAQTIDQIINECFMFQKGQYVSL